VLSDGVSRSVRYASVGYASVECSRLTRSHSTFPAEFVQAQFKRFRGRFWSSKKMAERLHIEKARRAGDEVCALHLSPRLSLSLSLCLCLYISLSLCVCVRLCVALCLPVCVSKYDDILI
jgi:hypothetical protein